MFATTKCKMQDARCKMMVTALRTDRKNISEGKPQFRILNPAIGRQADKRHFLRKKSRPGGGSLGNWRYFFSTFLHQVRLLHFGHIRYRVVPMCMALSAWV